MLCLFEFFLNIFNKPSFYFILLRNSLQIIDLFNGLKHLQHIYLITSLFTLETFSLDLLRFVTLLSCRYFNGLKTAGKMLGADRSVYTCRLQWRCITFNQIIYTDVSLSMF